MTRIIDDPALAFAWEGWLPRAPSVCEKSWSCFATKAKRLADVEVERQTLFDEQVIIEHELNKLRDETSKSSVAKEEELSKIHADLEAERHRAAEAQERIAKVESEQSNMMDEKATLSTALDQLKSEKAKAEQVKDVLAKNISDLRCELDEKLKEKDNALQSKTVEFDVERQRIVQEHTETVESLALSTAQQLARID